MTIAFVSKASPKKLPTILLPHSPSSAILNQSRKSYSYAGESAGRYRCQKGFRDAKF